LIGNNKIRSYIAILFLVVFVNTFLIKPIHLFTYHCEQSCSAHDVQHHSDSHHEENCSICQLSLSAYTVQDFAELHVILDLPVIEISEKEYYAQLQENLLNALLRAPPVL